MNRNYLIVTLAILFLFSCKSSSYMKHAYIDMKKSVNEAQVSLLKDTVKVVFPNSVLFDFGSATVKPEIHQAFEHFSQVLNKYNQTEVLICGYTDSIGTADRNFSLSKRRADSAMALLVYYKIDSKRLYTWGMGAKNAVASNNTEEGRQQNRRVEFVVLRKPKK